MIHDVYCFEIEREKLIRAANHVNRKCGLTVSIGDAPEN